MQNPDPLGDVTAERRFTLRIRVGAEVDYSACALTFDHRACWAKSDSLTALGLIRFDPFRLFQAGNSVLT